MADKHGIVRTDCMVGTDVGPYLASAKFFVENEDEEMVATEIDNGNVVKLNGYLTGEREIREAVTPVKTDVIDNIGVVTTPEVMYDERLKNLDDYFNEAGKTIRVHRLHKHDLFSVNALNLSIANGLTPAAGNVVELTSSTKLGLVASLTQGSTKVGTLERIETAGRYTYYVIRVV